MRYGLKLILSLPKKYIKVKLSEIETLIELADNKIIQGYKIAARRSFGVKLSSNKGFILLIEAMVLEYYEIIVQHMNYWSKPAPKTVKEIEIN